MVGPGFGKLGLASGAARSPGKTGAESPRMKDIGEVGPQVVVVLKRERGKYKVKWRGQRKKPVHEIWFLMDFFDDLQRYWKRWGRGMRIVDKDEIIDIEIRENMIRAKFYFFKHKTEVVA